jgi:hypothetical protein
MSTISTLLVFGGRAMDLALATDFCAMSRKFGRDGLNPRSLSGIDLVSTVQEFKTLKFGRDDLNRAREDVFTREQASSEERFYTIVGPGGFKVAIFDWLDDVKARALKGDRIVIVFCAHGSEDGCVVLNTQDEKEYLSRTEICNIRLLDIMTSSPPPCEFDFFDAVAWIVAVITHSWEISPRTFDLNKVLECVKTTLECAQPYLESA